jgi:chlorite dismutase
MTPAPTGQSDGHRQIVNFSFFQLDASWRRLPRAEREDHRREFTTLLTQWDGRDCMRVLTYSTVGTRADCDLMLWRICYSLDDLQQMTSDLFTSGLGPYLRTSHSYLGMTKRSQYRIAQENQRVYDARGTQTPGGCKYLFVYPFVRTRDWYKLPVEERQRMVNENISVGRDFPHLRLHVAYSFGMDDQEFVMAFETDHMDRFLDFAQELRETDSHAFVEREVPVFTCLRVSPDDMIERLG